LTYRFLEYLYPVVPPIKLVEVPAGKPDDIPPDGVRLVQLPEGPVMLEKTDKEVRAFSAICLERLAPHKGLWVIVGSALFLLTIVFMLWEAVIG
jgi:hypothetical protein